MRQSSLLASADTVQIR